ncbi:hypothetical protein ADUPG1_004377, partial [Aduncisulcus paluster]
AVPLLRKKVKGESSSKKAKSIPPPQHPSPAQPVTVSSTISSSSSSSSSYTSHTLNVGTLQYMAPELYSSTNSATSVSRKHAPAYNEAVDMYALGVILFE